VLLPYYEVIGGPASGAVLCKHKKTGVLSIAASKCTKKQVQVDLGGSGLAVTDGGSLSVTSAPTATNATNADTADNAATVDGFAPAALVRTAYSSGDVTVDATDPEDVIAQATITAPGPGFVVASANFQIAGGVGCPCGYWARLRNTGDDETSPQWGVAQVTTTDEYSSASNHWTFPVTASGDVTIVWEAYRNSGALDSTAYGQLTLLFVPFDGTGAPPTPAP
jgi:hypothetical protein